MVIFGLSDLGFVLDLGLVFTVFQIWVLDVGFLVCFISLGLLVGWLGFTLLFCAFV